MHQCDPGSPDSPPSIKLEPAHGGPTGPEAASVLRRYEFLAFGAGYKAEDHEAILALDDSHPDCINNPSCLYDPDMPVELGHYLGAQDVGSNLVEAPWPVPVSPAIALFVPALARFDPRRRNAARQGSGWGRRAAVLIRLHRSFRHVAAIK
ncbi:MAG: hypothetical protein AB7I32_21365 [Gammaproteobacteria bacterium]